uniref:type I protein arginine methyltransferase n=1 Tax=Albugo laibachii Nc14 TaxID=890382 RepID=F0X0H0_9STRA|nr:histonearginine methyltransferase putative [Albugo laibachii Nc14]|eukprot:CCA27260.1 histonearginine methyltransferase putative [Albugo laibachii Nc14]
MTTENDDNNPFSQYYGMLLHQQNMLQDYVRTSTYERAMTENCSDFKDKIVLDVGTGTGILAYFAIKAGAKHVYAVELSDVADCARELFIANGLQDRVTVLKSKMEMVELPQHVDIVISEPMGFFLVHERMLETYVNAGKKWRRPGDPKFKMFPSIGTMYVAPFTDENIYQEQMNKVVFWQNNDFYGLNLSALTEKAIQNHFSQPIVGYFPVSMLLCDITKAAAHEIDFSDVSNETLKEFTIPFRFCIEKTAILHGLACWFTVSFNGSRSRVVLSTAPNAPGTHWYQCRLLLPEPIAVNTTQSVSGSLHFKANEKYSYDIVMEVRLEGTSIASRNVIHLQDQMYHYLYPQSSEATMNS